MQAYDGGKTIVEGGRQTWLEHQYTKAQRAKTKKLMESALKRLINTCADSNDPNVLRAYGTWRNLDVVWEFCGGDDKKENGNGEP